MQVLAELAAEGARRFGDDPGRIAAYIEAGLACRSGAERDAIRHELAIMAPSPPAGTPPN